jgi:hypothetical protein
MMKLGTNTSIHYEHAFWHSLCSLFPCFSCGTSRGLEHFLHDVCVLRMHSMFSKTHKGT